MGYVDGNALAGALSLAFGRDMTTAETVCADCGDRHIVASTRVYLRSPGMVMRCPNCSAVELILTDIRGQLQIHLRSVASLHLA